MEDTSPEVKRLLRERYQRLTGAERFALGVGMFETARALVLASLPKGLSAQELRKRLCARFYGQELAERVYGRHAPQIHHER